MRKSKPRIFIGSSVESLPIAYAIQENLPHDALCQVWTQGIFELSGNALDNLIKAAGNSDYAIFVFQPDDISRIRNRELRTVRDNVVFEFGLFIGRIGKDKVFFLVPSDVDELHLPTDLLGIEPGRYEHQENEEDLLAALGPFCNKVRRIIGKSVENKIEEYDETSNKTADDSENIKRIDEADNRKSESIEYGVSIDEFGNYTISIEPTIFFDNRISGSFPGIRGLCWFDNPREGLDRLELLLRKPLKFERCVGHGTTIDSIWWFRGYNDMFIENFAKLSDTRCLLDFQELEIDRIAIYRSEAYYKSFVYVETKPDKPIGVSQIDEQDLERMIETFGYAYEEFGLFDGVPITRTCYDDGAAVIDGKVVDTSGAELRRRYLSRYNFIIASKFSSVNSERFVEYSEKIFNDILKDRSSIEELVKFIETLLPKSKGDIYAQYRNNQDGHRIPS